MKSASQLKDKSRNLSAATGIPPYIIQRNFFLERFLERVSLSDYRDYIILKGGVLIASMFGIEARSTMDLDATLKMRALTQPIVEEIVNKILQTSIDDGVTFSLANVERTRVETNYPGFRIALHATLNQLHDTIKLDFTEGDVITPKPIEYGYKLMFEGREISILAYNLETILAEKYTAILSLNIANTRMKDYYDILMMVTDRREMINPKVFVEAVINTARQRNMIQVLDKSDTIIDKIAQNPKTNKLWHQYQTTYSYATGIGFADTIAALKTLAEWQMQMKAPILGQDCEKSSKEGKERQSILGRLQAIQQRQANDTQSNSARLIKTQDKQDPRLR